MVLGGQCGEQAAPVEWQFLQCFGERTPGEEVQDGESLDRRKSGRGHAADMLPGPLQPCKGVQTLTEDSSSLQKASKGRKAVLVPAFRRILLV